VAVTSDILTAGTGYYADMMELRGKLEG